MVERFLSQTSFTSQEDFIKNLKINVPENFNFGYDVVDARAARLPRHNNGGFHHSKIMMVDSLFCTVGSTNLNSRSLRYDYEVNAFIFDKETTHELNTMFEHDKLDSTLFTKEEYKKRSGWKRFVGWFANLFTPFL